MLHFLAANLIKLFPIGYLNEREWRKRYASFAFGDENAAKNIKKLGLEAKPSTANVGQ